MNVSGIRPNAGFYQYNSIKLNELRNQQIEESRKAQALLEEQELKAKEEELPAVSDEEMSAMQQDARERQTFDAYDYAKQYRPSDSLEIGELDGRINTQDMQKAISNMQRDEVLKQYQFFVRNQEAVREQTMQNQKVARTGENFIL